MEIFKALHARFSQNFNVAIEEEKALLNEAEIKSRFLFEIGEQLKKSAASKTRIEVTEIFNELFSDITVAIYLATSSIHHSSSIMMRRVLELGIAVLYFWDMPHKYWSWKTISTHESDLNFKENVEYLAGATYTEYLKNEFEIDNWVCDKETINKFYRKLSNAIHGKFDTFATGSEDAFVFVKEEYKDNLQTIIGIENVLISCFKLRFESEFEASTQSIHAITRYTHGN